ncbi:MAG TPA: hypothetical protein PLQ93_06985 [Bacteroidia bacterium]|nr:hypothetical protein [Bacteroidia bacterium]
MKAYKPVNYRVFRLSDGSEVNAGAIEKLIEGTCRYVKHAVVAENESRKLVAFIIPDTALFKHPDYALTANDGCFCPRSLHELGKCLSGCMKRANEKIAFPGDQVKEAVLMNSKDEPEKHPELSFHDVLEKYRSILRNTFGNHVPPQEEIYFMKYI